MLTSDETGDAALRTVAGLGLVSDFIVGVHFTERNALPGVLEAMAKTRMKIGWGIDEPACAVFENGRFEGTLGRAVY